MPTRLAPVEVELPSGPNRKAITAPYFLGTKIEALLTAMTTSAVNDAASQARIVWLSAKLEALSKTGLA